MEERQGSEMDGSIRVSAKTVDDAITEAMIQLGVTSDRLEYEVKIGRASCRERV